MRHRKRGRQLGRQTKHRWALFRSLVTSLLEHDRIETTEAKAKELRVFAERMITLGKQGTLAARRAALSFIRQKAVVEKLFDETAGRFADRSGGYTRIIKTRRRVGDGAEMVAIELVVQPTAAAQTKGDGAKSTPKPTEPDASNKSADEAGGEEAKAKEPKAPKKPKEGGGKPKADSKPKNAPNKAKAKPTPSAKAAKAKSSGSKKG